MNITHSAIQKEKQILTVIRGVENPEFKMKILTSNKRKARGHFFSCSPLLKSIGSSDSFSSLVTTYPKGGGEKSWVKKYEDLMNNHCIIKPKNTENTDTIEGVGNEKYWLRAEDLIWFLDTYESNKEEQREAMQMYRDWIKTLIEFLPKSDEMFAVDKFFLNDKDVVPTRDLTDDKKDAEILNTFTKVAKMLQIKRNVELMPFLRKRGIIYKQRKTNLATQKFLNQGYFKTIEARAGGKVDGQLVPQTMITNKGYLWIKKLWETKK